MSSTKRANLIYPEVLSEEVIKGLPGMNVFSGSKAIVINPGLQNGRARVNTDVRVPYFTHMGKAQVVPEGAALTPKKLEMSSEQGTIIHMGDAVSVNALAEAVRATKRSIYDVARDMMLSGLAATIDDVVIQRMIARAVATSMVHDGSAANISPEAIISTMKLFGDELTKPPPALWAMNSSVLWDVASIKDSTGRPLYVQNAGTAPSAINNVPIQMSDKSDLLVASSSPQEYYSLLAKEGAVAVWIDAGGITIEEDRDSLADDTLLVYHAYMVIHAYGTMAGGTKAGVAAMRTRAST